MALALTGVLIAIWLVSRAGLFDAGDGYLRSLYYAIRGTETVSERVVFVAMDEHTGEAWGPPPWSWQRYAEMLETIIDAKPRVVAVLEPGPRVLPASAPRFGPAVMNAIAEGRIVLPSIAPGLGQPRLALDAGPHVEAVALARAPGNNELTATARTIRAAGLPAPDGELLWVHYLGGPSSLPTVPAHRIASGEIPANTFDDRIVIVGLRGQGFAPLVPTPIGPMSPAEVHAYAVRALAHDAVWAPMPSWARWLLAGSLGLICMLILPLSSLRLSIAFLVAVGAAILVADYALFTLGILRLGASVPLGAAGLAAVAAWLAERNRVLRELEALSRWSAQRLALGAAQEIDGEAFAQIWERFARTTRTFTQLESTLLGELPEGHSHLQFELAFGVAADRIHELRRDVRREPYKNAIMMHRPIWSDHFMHDELDQKTLLVPLTSFNRVLGIWVLNYRKGVEVSSNVLRMIELLAEQLSLTLERRRVRKLRSGRGAVRESLLLRPIQEMRTSMQFFTHEQSNLSRMFESLPVGVLVATLWGEVEYINAAMRGFLAALHVDSAKQHSLPELLAALTDASEAEVHETVMRLFAGSPFVELSCHPHADIEPAHQVTLSALSGAPLLAEAEAGPAEGVDAMEDAGDNISALSHLVLTVTRRAPASSQSVRKSAMSGG